MRRKLLASTVLTTSTALMASAAWAADLPVKAPGAAPVKARFSWTGCYAGVNAGGAFNHIDQSVAIPGIATFGAGERIQASPEAVSSAAICNLIRIGSSALRATLITSGAITARISVPLSWRRYRWQAGDQSALACHRSRPVWLCLGSRVSLCDRWFGSRPCEVVSVGNHDGAGSIMQGPTLQLVPDGRPAEASSMHSPSASP